MKFKLPEVTNRRRFDILFASAISLPFIALVLLLYGVGCFEFIPSFEELENPKTNIATEIISGDGVLLGTFHIENRSFTPYEELSANLIYALIATEDIRFFDHAGIDFRSLARVLVKTILGGDRSSGGGRDRKSVV